MTPVEELKSLDLKTVDVETISNILVKLDSFGATGAKLLQNTYFSRMRPGHGFSFPWEVSYNSHMRYSTKFQRMTMPGDVVFYGCFSDDEHKQENLRALGIAE